LAPSNQILGAKEPSLCGFGNLAQVINAAARRSLWPQSAQAAILAGGAAAGKMFLLRPQERSQISGHVLAARHGSRPERIQSFIGARVGAACGVTVPDAAGAASAGRGRGNGRDDVAERCAAV